MALTTEYYLQQLQALLPGGLAWPREADTVLAKLLSGLAEEFARVDTRADNLVDEADPRTAWELFEDWERVAGLPDICVGELETIQERRDAVMRVVTSIGGQSSAYFIEVAARLGYEITITESPVYQSAFGFTEDEWLFVWQVNSAEAPVYEFAAGASVAGEPLRNWGNTLLECAIEQLKPAHTYVLFSYG